MDRVDQAFERRLDRGAARPVVVAFSGGSDSLALLERTASWARPSGRPVVAVTIDHGLQPQSAAWTVQAGQVAENAGARFRSLIWAGPKPTTGLPAAARAARHRLLAQAAHEEGASVILLGHTRDDMLETAVMRQEGSTLGILHEWSPSPVWPEGGGLFHFRPLLHARRRDLQAWLAGAGRRWIDDPANDDPRYARARARAALALTGHEPEAYAPSPDADVAALALAFKVEPWGFSLSRATWAAASAGAGLRVLAAAIACASGREVLPRAAKIQRLAQRLAADGAVIATLSGARIQADDRISIMREAGEGARGGLLPIALPSGGAVVWDGRYALSTQEQDLEVRAMAGLARRLPREQAVLLRQLPPGARSGLPVVVGAQGAVSCPVLAGEDLVRCRPLYGPRFLAACGLIAREA